MARLGMGSILGGMSGKIGPVVISSWKSVNVVRSLPARHKKSKKHVAGLKAKYCAKFKYISHFLRNIAAEAIRLGYQLPEKSRVTGNNMALSYHIQHAVCGVHPDYKIDFRNVRLSLPLRTIEQAWNTSFTVQQDTGLSVKWELNPFPQKSTRDDDQAVIVLYNITLERKMPPGKFLSRTPRSALKFNFSGAGMEVGNDVCGWMFFISADGKRVSETEYLGMLKVLA